LKTFNTALVVAIGWLLIITILLCIPGTELPKFKWDNKIWLDKWVHIFLFLVLVLFWCRAYSKIPTDKKNTFVVITILSVLFGIAMEVVQHYFIPFRSFDLTDILGDAVGSVIGYFISIKRFAKV
jgi:VanZ family protein